MENLKQIDIDELERVMSSIDIKIENIESVVYDKRSDKVKLAYFLGKLHNELMDDRNAIQNVLDRNVEDDLPF